MNVDIWTIGHSSLPIEHFLELLAGQEIEALTDVRRFAGSRKHPHFGAEALAETLAAHHIAYVPFPELGGRRAPDPDSLNTVWRNASFRAYADFMETPEFHAGLDRLLRLARECRTAMMCSEAVWWRCHRSLIADALKIRGIRVLHIMSRSKVTEHPYTAPARIEGGRLVYGPAGR